ncbi:L,D-transpeptidase family protein [Altererythrobacter sp. C41]|uniref:L,D-transpeptidase family protein n=1 Tax=Altererythrobacter sp. C41 TaxID=2806021 RepID=UPI00193223D5|nr:L,D-transpeptidase family protein [Altererythrobacter sp. C41]MBM0169608.1 L,D-transpeptidase family protein [Altererythrobacter sp. C41]
MTSKLSPIFLAAASLTVLHPAAVAAQQQAPENLLPESQAVGQYPVRPDNDVVASEPARPVRPVPPAPVAAPGDPVRTIAKEVVQQFEPAVQPWTVANAEQLATVIAGIGTEGLDPADYDELALRQAIAGGPGEQLDQVASRAFAWLVEDMRDGRTPMEARKQWFVVDPDPDRYRTGDVMAGALASGDIAGALQNLAPLHPDYAKLKAELAATPAGEASKRKLIRANMDRWRWLARDLGNQYLMTNVPEFQLRLTVNDKILRTYKTIVGKPGRTATPQLAETVEGVIFNPNWTVPQSIVKGEGLGARVLGNPGWARANGYKGWRDKETGFVTVVQQPGPGNSLGLMKLDMPNPHAIFLHDTPSRHLFNNANRALSHGCIRTERASELAITLAILAQAPKTDEERKVAAGEAVEILKSGEYTKVPFTTRMPVYITYFTMGTDIDGEMRSFKDIYGRDAPVLAALDQPRQENRARRTSEEAVEIIDDMKTT